MRFTSFEDVGRRMMGAQNLSAIRALYKDFVESIWMRECVRRQAIQMLTTPAFQSRCLLWLRLIDLADRKHVAEMDMSSEAINGLIFTQYGSLGDVVISQVPIPWRYRAVMGIPRTSADRNERWIRNDWNEFMHRWQREQAAIKSGDVLKSLRNITAS